MDDKRLDDLVRAEVVSREEYERADSDSGKGFGDDIDKSGLTDVVGSSIKNLGGVVSNSFKISYVYLFNFTLGAGLGFILEDNPRMSYDPEYTISILDHLGTFFGVFVLVSTIDLMPVFKKANKLIYHSRKNYLYSKAYFLAGAIVGALFASYLR